MNEDCVGHKEKNPSNTFPKGRLIFFATGNFHKFEEARKVLSEFNIATAMLRIYVSEMQDDDIENIAKASALEAASKSCLPVIVEDAGLFVDALNGFPGPYSKYVFNTIGLKGILKLLENHENRAARFKSVIAYCSPKEPVKCFHGTVEGWISKRIQGTSGFGFDPIFIPKESPEKSFGQMTETEKNEISHRARALRRFAEWYKSGF